MFKSCWRLHCSSDHELGAREVVGVLPDVGLSTVGGPPLTLAAAPVLLKLIYQELTSRPDQRETEQSRKSCRPAWVMKAGMYLLDQSTVDHKCCGSSDFWIWTLHLNFEFKLLIKALLIMVFLGEPTSTHLRNRLSSSSCWCLSLVLRLHSSSSDLLMSLLFSKRLMRSSSNLDRKHFKLL